MTNYDYIAIDEQLKKRNNKFPYGVEDVILIKRSEITAIRATSYSNDWDNGYSLDLETNKETYSLYLATKRELLESIQQVTQSQADQTLTIVLSKKDDEGQRDYVSRDYSLFTEALTCL